MKPVTTLSFAGQKRTVSVGPFSSLTSEECGWCCRVVAILDCLQSLTSHLAKREISCYLQRGFAEKALNPEEEGWFPEPSALSRQHAHLHVQGWRSQAFLCRHHG